ncbi:sulfatase-like hydrolase/transferase [Salinispora cortesiana]|uniref:sulfatase-like hydrolase/transferase n=1 Tax=Salinispora cortesiana TaxID=1305843 RepID=UPI0003FE3293|nr:sulfatase-like hydrolase/transferase [Salinispora cortesiana]
MADSGVAPTPDQPDSVDGASDRRAGAAGDPDSAPRRGWRAEGWRLLELAALLGLVVTQPLLDVLGQSPDFFLFHRASRGEIVQLVVLVAIVPTVALGALAATSRLAGRTAREVTHTLLVGLLFAALAVQVGRHATPLRGVPLLVLALVLALAATVAYRRWRAPARVLRVAALGPAVFIALFLLVSPTSTVVLPRGDGGAVGLARAGGHPPVVLLILDELPLVSLLGPEGQIDADRFPHFAELAAGSTWYRNATGVSGWTPYALPAMLTGRYPATGAAPHYSQHPDNLFTAFGGLYDIRAEESITRLCPPSRCETPPGREQGMGVLARESAKLLARISAPTESRVDPADSYREQTAAEAGIDAAEPIPADPKFRWDRLNDNQPARFSSFLAGLQPSARPTLHFLHLLMPHSPWAYLPSGVRYAAPEDFPNEGEGWVELARQRHLAQLGYTDRLIGETLRTLRATGLYDDALLVVTADHGVSFTKGAQGRGMGAIEAAADEVAWVPLFVKYPGQRTGRLDDRNWQHVDLLPTLADEAAIRLPWAVDGRSAREAPRAQASKVFYDRPAQPTPIGGGVPTAAPPVVPHPLIGSTVPDQPTAGVARVENLAAFREVDPDQGLLPALVWGDLPDEIPDGTPLAVAINGRVAVVVPVVGRDEGGRRFAALIGDDQLFRSGTNQLGLFLVAPDGTLTRLALS